MEQFVNHQKNFVIILVLDLLMLFPFFSLSFPTLACNTDITVSFAVNESTVSESNTVRYLRVDVEGFFPDPSVVGRILRSFFIFYTRDGSAEGEKDIFKH